MATIYDYLDEYDFSEFLTEGRSLYNIMDCAEEKYDNDSFNKHGTYLFDNIDPIQFGDYLIKRYGIKLQEYKDWVVRKEG